MIFLSENQPCNLAIFRDIVFGGKNIAIDPSVNLRLAETRSFINFILKNNIRVYGITTGFADLRDHKINSKAAAELSENLIESHDAGIGDSFSPEIVFGAMVARAFSLSKGNSGFSTDSLCTLIEMINHKIIPLIPKTGSLGASGDLCMLARLARAMQGKEVPVWYNGKVISAKEAIKACGIKPFNPLAKEGLAMINGTSFMTSMISIAYLQEMHELENIMALQGLFYSATGTVDEAFNKSIHDVRKQKGQLLVASILSSHFTGSPFINNQEIQNDYSIRCVPQIFGPKIEIILEQYKKIERELDAVTDNPLFFRGEEITPDVDPEKIINFLDENWVVISGGNFHGECITTIADAIGAANAKIAITLERQIGYMLNPSRNKGALPIYLIPHQKDVGLNSGYMIAQYTANSLTQKICQLGAPTSIFNISSGNESEDIVSFGANAAERLLEQIAYLRELSTIYLTVAIQAYSIQREKLTTSGQSISSKFLPEKIYQEFLTYTVCTYPIEKDENFNLRYNEAKELLKTNKLRALLHYPFSKELEPEDAGYFNQYYSHKVATF